MAMFSKSLALAERHSAPKAHLAQGATLGALQLEARKAWSSDDGSLGKRLGSGAAAGITFQEQLLAGLP